MGKGAPGARPVVSPFGGSPPPIPPGFYNPIRDIESAEGKKGTEQTLSGDERQRTVGENTYATNLALLDQREAQQKQSSQETLARLAESYKKLGVRQGEGANAGGTLYGGALLASAMKRNANEGVTKGQDELALTRQEEANANERGRLSTSESQLVGPGGSLTEAMQNAQVNQQGFQQGLQTLMGDEAASNGYVPPAGPSIGKGTPQRSQFDKVNPANKQRYREERSGGKTVHVYENGHRVVMG